MLRHTQEIADRYRIKFGQEKSKLLVIGQRKQEDTKLQLGDMEIEETQTYKYLGQIFNKNMNMKEQINEIERKTEAAYQTIIQITNDAHYKDIEMTTMWKLYETCIKPIVLYAAESWDPTKTEMKQIQQILDSIIRRLLRIPRSTPLEALRLETGSKTIMTEIDTRRIMNYKRLQFHKEDRLIKTVTKPNEWWGKLVEISANRMFIDKMMLDYLSKTELKEAIESATRTNEKKEIIEKSKDKSKMQFYLQGKRYWKVGVKPKYMNELNRNDCSTIIKARTRMLEVKSNYKNKYKDKMCRLCKKEEETQEHILSDCETLENMERIKTKDLFTENSTNLKRIAKAINNRLKKIEEQEKEE